MITMKELNPNGYPTDAETQANLEDLLSKLNQVRAAYGKPMFINSGLRSQADQARINPNAPKSKHLTGQAADIRDNDGSFWKWCMAEMHLMVQLGIYFEDKGATPTWVHMQSQPPRSGKRIFIP